MVNCITGECSLSQNVLPVQLHHEESLFRIRDVLTTSVLLEQNGAKMRNLWMIEEYLVLHPGPFGLSNKEIRWRRHFGPHIPRSAWG